MKWKTEIKRNGIWPLRWSWAVQRTGTEHDYAFRSGDSFTKERAHRAAAAARWSIEHDDLIIVENE